MDSDDLDRAKWRVFMNRIIVPVPQVVNFKISCPKLLRVYHLVILQISLPYIF